MGQIEMNTAEEITRLSDLYYRAIGPMHHKDRDCHWFVTKRWSYGNPPYYLAEHHGYLAEFYSPKCASAAGAEAMLLGFLQKEIEDLRKAAEEWDPHDEGWGLSEHEANDILEVLNG